MSRKKRFGISEALTRGLSETINAVENNSGLFRNVVLSLSRVELDPDNPRKLFVDLADVRQGLRADDPHYQQKHEEIERLKELAHTIKTSGIINPIVVYKRGESYRIVAGERRCLASILAGKQEIDARVFNEKPKTFELKLVQWVENTAREDLTLNERLENVREIVKAYIAEQGETEMTATLLKQITGLSLSQTSYYVAALNAPEDVKLHIRNGSIRNLDKAALLAGIIPSDVRSEALAACINGASLKDIRQIVAQHKMAKRKHETVSDTRGRATIRIHMGSTLNSGVVKTIIEAVTTQKPFGKYNELFLNVNWNDLRQTTKAFRQLIEILEVEI